MLRRNLGVLVAVLGVSVGCSDEALLGPEDGPDPADANVLSNVSAQDYHCHWEDDPPDGGDDPPVFATGWVCHYIPGGEDDEPPDDDGPGGGGGGSHDSTLGFLAWIVPDVGMQHSAPRCPPPSAGNVELRATAHAWCKAKAPTAQQRVILEAAIERMAHGRGPVCKEISDTAKRLLQEGKLRLYRRSDVPSPLPVMGGMGFAEGIVLLDSWLQLLFKTKGQAPYAVNLEHAIAHEVQHHQATVSHANLPNAPAYYAENPHDRACAGFVDAPL